MKPQKIVFLFLLSLLCSACQQIEKTATPVVVPSATAFARFQRILSANWFSPVLPINEECGKKPKLYFSVIGQTEELKRLITNTGYQEKLANVDFAKNILVLVEWGIYFSGGIKVEVTDVKIDSNQVELTVETFFPDPKIAQAAACSIALDFITISRQEFDAGKPVQFKLIHQGAVVSSTSVEIH